MINRSHEVFPLLSGPALRRCYQSVNPTWKLKFKFHISEKHAQSDTVPDSQIENKNQNNKKFLFDTVVTANHDKNNERGCVVLGTIVRRKNIQIIIDFHNARKNANFPEGVLHIFSVTDYWEIGDKAEAKPEDWKNANAIHHQIPMTDFKSEIVPEAILATVYEMRKILEKNPNNTIYIHCKAGKARSAMIVSAYISIFGKDHKINLGEKPDIVMGADYAKSKRRQVDLHQDDVSEYGINRIYDVKSAGKIHKAQKAVDLHYELSHDLSSANKELTTENYINEFNEYMRNRLWPQGHTPVGNTPLSTLEFKNMLVNTIEFKQLMILCVNTDLSLSIKNDINIIFSKIYHATDDNWIIILDQVAEKYKLNINNAVYDYLDAIKKISINQINIVDDNQISPSDQKTQQTKTWHRVNNQICIASDLKTGLLKQDWQKSSRTLHPVEEILAPPPIIAMLDKIDMGMYEYNTDNTMATALKQIIFIALLESITEKNSNAEAEYYKKFSSLIDIEKSILNIKNEIEKSHFKVHGLNAHEIINNEEVPRHVKQIHNLCADTSRKNDINKLIQILAVTKHHAIAGTSLSGIFSHDDVTKSFYQKIARHLILKEMSELKLVAAYLIEQQFSHETEEIKHPDATSTHYAKV